MHQRRYLLSIVSLTAALALFRGCSHAASNDPDEAPLDAGADTIADAPEPGRQTPRDDAGPAEPKPCLPRSLPKSVPEGWIEYPVFNCEFRLYVPSERQYLPEPIRWEDCIDVTQDVSFACRQLAFDPETEVGGFVGGIPNGYRDQNGQVVLQLRKILPTPPTMELTTRVGLVAEADGAVRQALLVTGVKGTQPPYWLVQGSSSPGKATWRITANIPDDKREGILGGDDTELAPPVMYERPEKQFALALAGSEYWAEHRGGLEIRDWEMNDLGRASVAGLGVGTYAWAGPHLVWDQSAIPFSGLWIWSPGIGTRKLRAFDDDRSRAAASVGTDGVDLVWIEGEGLDPQSGDWRYPIRSVMTAPFTTDPQELSPRRLRSWTPDVIWELQTPVVGCGYAAFVQVPQVAHEQLLIVRLADGASWTLTTDKDRVYQWISPVALTCDEVFVFMNTKRASMQLWRVRLDSLGEPVKAD